MNRIAGKLEFETLDGTPLDYLVLTSEGNNTVVTEGNLLNRGTYFMDKESVIKMAWLKGERKYNQNLRAKISYNHKSHSQK
jgi:hypothetical protein